ncbi:MAG: hypothetical protein EOO81_11625 [Oxalobacteraceae bacterium]|nr:MAG: hypothetical protein EOO81_11625 [Oxalobacteraceae bacterium]
MTKDVSADPGSALDVPGVYLLLWADMSRRSAESFVASDPELEFVPICVGDDDVSMSADIHRSILGTADLSLTRAAMGLMLQDRLGLVIAPAETRTGVQIMPEERLTAWLLSRTVIGYAPLAGFSAAGLHQAFSSGDVEIDGSAIDEIALSTALSDFGG